jgi:general secretion pathway protein D
VAGGAAGASTNFAATNIVPRGSTNDIPANMMRFQEADLSQIFELYSELTGRTILRSPQVPQNVKISVRNQTALTRQEGSDALNTILGLNQITMVPEGDKFIKAVPQASLPQEATPFTTNDYTQLPASGAPVAQIVTLKNLLPEEATSILQPFAKLPNSIIGVRGSPVLVLRDAAVNVQRMLEILERVDVEMPLDIDTVVIPIKYALAGEIAGVLSGLGATTSGSFGTSAAGGAGGFGAGGVGGFGAGGIGGAGGLNRGGVGGIGGGVGGLQGGSYQGVGGVGGVRQFGTSGALGAQGGQGAFGGSRTAFGQSLNRAVVGAVNRAGGAGAAPGEFALIGNAKIIPDERSNALLVFADRRDLGTISNIIAKLDVVLPQVLIEALILEVNLGDGKNIGVSMKQNNQRIGDLNVAGGSVNGPGFLDPRSISGVTSIASNTLPSGFSYFGKLNEDFDFAVTASANDSRINVLSRPRIQTSTAKPASIFIGETRPYVTGTYFSDFAGSGSRSQYAQTQIGISLNVLPIINQEGLVVMDIAQDISQVGGTVRVDNNDVPITINRTASAYVAVHDRDTIILGGFISTTKSKNSSGVPILKDIPGLGVLFRSRNDNIARVELMVLIRPTVLPTPEAAALTAASERDKLPSIKRAERDEQEFYNKQLEKERKEEEKAEQRNNR